MPLLYSQTSFTILNLGLGLGLDKASADYDNDGDMDLLTCNGLYRNDSGFFTLQSGTGLPTMTVNNLVRWIDFNNDGYLDLFVNVNLSSNVIYINNGQGVFSMINVGLPNLECYDVEFADFDNDCDLDVILVGTYYDTKIYENVNGTYVYVNYGIDNPYAGGCDWGDYDNDGDLDFVLTGRMGNMRIYRNDVSQSGVRTFNNVINLPTLEGSDVEWGDYDNDGDLDILVIGEVGDYSSNYTWVYQNNNGVFTNINAPLVGANYGNVAWLDLDNDSDLDIIAGGVQNEAANPDVPYSAIYINNNGLYSMIMDFPYQDLCISAFDYDSDGDLDIYLKCELFNPPNSWSYSSIMLRNEFVPPGPPEITNVIEPIVMNMNDAGMTIDLLDYFTNNGIPLEFYCTGNLNVECTINNESLLTLSPAQNWYGTEYITIRATNSHGYAEQTLKVTVIQTWQTTEDFDQADALPVNWITQHSGTTSFPWQAVQLEGTNYAMKTMATTGGTANERLLSPVYNLSNYKDIQVSFDSDFLPYGSGTGSFAYTLNNLTYTVVETYTTSHSGMRTYTISAIDAKPTVRFRWLYSNSTANTGQNNYWIIDNFKIFGIVKDTQAPEAVTELSLVSQDNHSALLSWNPSSDLYFDRYELYVSSDNNVTTTDRLWSVNEDHNLYFVSTTQTRINPLTEGEYWIAIRAVDRDNNTSLLSESVYVRIDATGPTFSNPIPSDQPEPEWSNSRIVTIGCQINDLNNIDLNSIKYRIDTNGNGIFDEDEIWQALPPAKIMNGTKETINVNVTTEYLADGLLAFEFQATDIYNNTGYSGTNGIEGIEDDWIVRIDTTPPVFTNPIPPNQPNPEWENSLTVIIGATIQDLTIIENIMYRYDENGNGIYDEEEIWYPVTSKAKSDGRDIHSFTIQLCFDTDGVYAFEFKATDIVGNIGYSGMQNLEGIDDDWIVRIDRGHPIFSEPIPANQPLPNWSDSFNVMIGATISDNRGIDSNSVRYRIDYNRNGVYDVEENWQIPVLSKEDRTIDNVLNASIPVSISADGIYKFEIKASNLYNATGYSGLENLEGIEDDWIFRVDTTPPAPIGNFFVQEVYSDAILLHWTATTDLNFAGYRIYYSTSPDVSDTDMLWDSSNDSQLAFAGEGIISTTITGLLPATRYYFILQAFDEVGHITQYPQVISAMTSSSAIPMTPQNLVITVSGYDIILNWEAVTLDTSQNPINISYYEVYVSDQPYFACNIDNLLCTTETPSLLIEGGAEFADRLFFKIKAVSGAITKKDKVLPQKK